ncbi:54S ribosomal protein L24, mitochondrial [Leucoagaricus sp. SymC.cos]|nr:54S ribosomal protein L24, mitochondrial [Leucoagaricus sp. SymC.cos]
MFPTLAWFSEVVSQPFKRSQYGLFQGRMKQYGNNVPFSKHKTRRTWLPNVQSKRLFSDTLDRYLKLKVTTRALRTIKKHGGLDGYLEKTSAETLGHEGMRLRLMIREKKEKKSLPPKRDLAPQLRDALKARKQAGKYLRLPGLANAKQTIAYINRSSKT